MSAPTPATAALLAQAHVGLEASITFTGTVADHMGAGGVCTTGDVAAAAMLPVLHSIAASLLVIARKQAT